MSGAQLYTVIGVETGNPKEIHLLDLKWILGILINNDNVRADMKADAATTLSRLNYIPNAKAVAFFDSLRTIGFDTAIDALVTTPSAPTDPAFNMAEC